MSVMDRVDKQSAWTDVTERDHKFKKTGLKQGHLWHLPVSKDVSTKHHYGEIPQTLSRKSVSWGVSLKCMHTIAWRWGINMTN